MKKVNKGSFHQGIFYGALCHHFGREADYAHRLGFNGFYQWIWDATEAEIANRWSHNNEVTMLEYKASEVVEWLNFYDLDASSNVSYGFHGFPRSPSMKEHRVLVTISLPKEEKNEG